MGVINLKISDETENAFREELPKRMRYKKGVLGKAVDEALRNWIYRLYAPDKLDKYARMIWVQDIPKEKSSEYKFRSETIYPKLEYFEGPTVKRKEKGFVGMYYRLRSGKEP